MNNDVVVRINQNKDHVNFHIDFDIRKSKFADDDLADIMHTIIPALRMAVASFCVGDDDNAQEVQP